MTLIEQIYRSLLPTKQCSDCFQEKPLTKEYWYFQAQHKKRAGLTVYVAQCRCKECSKNLAREHHQFNRDDRLAYYRQDRLKNPDKYAEWARQNREKHTDKIKARNKAAYEANREARKEYERSKRRVDGDRVRAMDNARRAANPEKYKAQSRARAAANREKIAAQARAYRAANPENFKEYEKRRYNFDRRIRSTVTGKIIKQLKDNGTPKQQLRRFITGWSFDELMDHIAPLFEHGMRVDNWGEWQLDHIIPVSLVQFSDEHDQSFKDVWSLSNLAPLWSFDNNSKHNRLDWVMPETYQNELLREMYRNPPMKHLLQGFEGYVVK